MKKKSSSSNVQPQSIVIPFFSTAFNANHHQTTTPPDKTWNSHHNLNEPQKPSTIIDQKTAKIHKTETTNSSKNHARSPSSTAAWYGMKVARERRRVKKFFCVVLSALARQTQLQTNQSKRQTPDDCLSSVCEQTLNWSLGARPHTRPPERIVATCTFGIVCPFNPTWAPDELENL